MGDAAPGESVHLADLVKSLEGISPGVETSGIFLEKQNVFHVVHSDLCSIKINLWTQLLVRALGLF